ncbi:hypothetical protein [Gilliamella sp. App4-10]|uniref:hypothetical protein n=1 Tax=Gilliamella sp. App4-10 TaxID=3120231 RepID=UPI00114729A0|nr:hypothetical protein [Gilliamella apicola]
MITALIIAKGTDPRPGHRRAAQAKMEILDEEGYEAHHNTSLTLEMFIPRWKALKFKSWALMTLNVVIRLKLKLNVI